MANATVTYMKRKGVPLTEDNYRFFNWPGAPPEEMSLKRLLSCLIWCRL